MKKLWNRIRKAFAIHNVSCRYLHKWKYVGGGLTRICKKCECTEITVGEEPSMYRIVGDKWVRTYNGC